MQWFNRSAPAVKSGEVVPEELDEPTALALMRDNPLLIRRPLLQVGDERRVGFDAAADRRLDRPGARSPTTTSKPAGNTVAEPPRYRLRALGQRRRHCVAATPGPMRTRCEQLPITLTPCGRARRALDRRLRPGPAQLRHHPAHRQRHQLQRLCGARQRGRGGDRHGEGKVSPSASSVAWNPWPLRRDPPPSCSTTSNPTIPARCRTAAPRAAGAAAYVSHQARPMLKGLFDPCRIRRPHRRESAPETR
jgi:hypothetical protein